MIAILEDDRLMRETLRRLLEEGGHRVVACAATGSELLSQLAEASPEHVIALVDLTLRDETGTFVDDGPSSMRALRAFRGDVRIIAMSADGSPQAIQRSVEAGAIGFLKKVSVGPAEILSAVQEAMQATVAPVPTRRIQGSLLETLTAREFQVLEHVALGEDNLKIAACLGITERTVKAHVSRLYEKIGHAENRVQLALVARHLMAANPGPASGGPLSA
jgi:two-component system, NarL family, nitrate/nitrite response regulator NarL